MQEIISEFEKLTRIPRPSGHEEKVSEYLENRAKELGFPVIRDAQNNIVFDIPATKGMEEKPLVGLQAHMDMVFAQKDGGNLDPLTTCIAMKNDGKDLTADGTSLGADDGIGIAMILCIAEGKMEHGPLRAIITTGEEVSMGGAQGLDPAMLEGVSYLINIDSEEEGHVTVSSAAGVTTHFTKYGNPEKPGMEKAWKISLLGLSGGHSGVDIDKNRLNAVTGLGKALQEAGPLAVASMKGGSADNAIPTSAEAVICMAESDVEVLRSILQSQLDAHKISDPDGKYSIEETGMPREVMEASLQKALLGLCCHIRDGCLVMSSDVDGLVQTSSNLGILQADAKMIRATGLARSSDPLDLQDLCDSFSCLSEENGMEYKPDFTAEAWKFNPESRLLKITKEAYHRLFGKEISVDAIHAGLECGCFMTKNPALDIISIGATLRNPHTVREACEIESIGKVWNLLEEILRRAE